MNSPEKNHSQKKNKTILVTGGAGFIGSNLIPYLLNVGHKVICLDNFFTGRYENIHEFMKNPNFQLMKADVCNSDLHFEKIDQIYHLACPASPPHYQLDPIKTAQTCFIGTLNMLNLAQSYGARILITSTSEIYGDPDEAHHPQTEKYRGNVNCTGPRSCYDEGKRISETLAFDHYRMHKTNICIARIFNTYGPQMRPDDGRVVTNFITQCINEKPITIYGDGTQTRSFCYVDDTVNGLILLMNSVHQGPYNIGNPYEITISDLAIYIMEKFKNNKHHVQYKPLPKDDPLQRKPDISKAIRDLNWLPKIAFNDGLEKTIEYLKKDLFVNDIKPVKWPV